MRVSSDTHTPGPWAVTHRRVIERPVRIREHYAIAPVAGPTMAFLPEGRADIQEANARLIAAAPDLKRVLTACYHALESYAHGNGSEVLAKECANAAFKVLQKAEGKAS